MSLMWSLRLILYLSPISLLVVSLPLHAVALDNTVALHISPQLCITHQNNTSCDISLELTWTGIQSEMVCIISNQTTTPLWCSETANEQSLTLHVNTDQDIHFRLIAKNSQQILAETSFKVTQMSEPQVRRRYRNPWSLF